MKYKAISRLFAEVFFHYFYTFKILSMRMKTIITSALLLLFFSFAIAQTPCEDGMAGEYPCNHIDFLSFTPLSEIGGGQNTNDLWGWVSPVTGKEYALVGCNNGTAFVDVSNPVSPVYLGILPPHTGNSLWRDIETYHNYCFIGSEAAGHGLQVFDLLQLDNVTGPPQTFSESAYYGGFGNSHVVTIDTLNGFLYACGTNTYNGGLHIVNIQNPLNPTLAGGFALEGYTHDCMIWNYDGPDEEHVGKQIVFASNGVKLAVVDCTDKTDCESLGAYTYPGLGYVHQGIVTKDRKHFVLNDELDEQNFANAGTPIGTRTHLFQIEDLDNLQYMGFHEANSTAIDHNMYVMDHLIYESNYTSGLRIFDAVRVADTVLTEIAYFDLFPENDVPVFEGTWSNYAFLPSGINIATSIYDGLFIMRPRLIEPSQKYWDICNADEISFDLAIHVNLAFPLTLALSGLEGAETNNLVIAEPGTYPVFISSLEGVAEGNYTPKLLLQTNFGEEYVVDLNVIISETIPEIPILTSIPNGESINSIFNPTLVWEEVNNASQYEVQISLDNTFDQELIVDELVDITSYFIDFPLENSEYHWRVRAFNDCGMGEWSQSFVFYYTIANVKEELTTGVRLFPNPANTFMTIVSQEPIQSWSILDLSGRQIAESIENAQTTYRLNIESLDPGIYFLKINQEVVKFVKH